MRRFFRDCVILIFNRSIYRYCKSKLDGYLRHICTPKPKLTSNEKKEIDKVWGILGLKCNYEWFEFYKAWDLGFSPYYVPQDIWNYMEASLNPMKYRTLLSHKGFLHKFFDKKYLPDSLVNVIAGTIYDRDDQIISFDTAVEILSNQQVYIKKYSTNSGGGAGVCFFDFSCSRNEEKKKLISESLVVKDDVIFQKILTISGELSKYNPYSINTIRVFSLNLNGYTSVVSSYMRMSSSDRKNDNVCTGGLYIGVKENGALHDYALDAEFRRFYTSPSGLKFREEKIRSYERIKEVVTNLHRNIPFVRFIAWDITVDIDDNIRIIEINLDAQNLEYHQPFNGPIFGDRTKEVIQYVLDNPPKRLMYI